MKSSAILLTLLLSVVPPPAVATSPPPRILVLGSPHLQGVEPAPAAPALQSVVAALLAFEPDLVAVEYLPADWPAGRGRDYRRAFDLDRYASTWGLTANAAGASPASAPCRLGRQYFLQRDFANALYYWLGRDCPVTADPDIAGFLRARGSHEMATIAMPVARARGLAAVVGIDDQSDDAAWFLDDLQREVDTAAARFAPLQEGRARLRERIRAVDSGLAARLRFFNGPEWLDLQRWFYEEQLPKIRYQRAGRHQTIHYWLRNHRMFDRLRDAVEAEAARRILVVVGAGHKYFLDTLARDAGYRWVDPLDYLPGAGRARP